jgi:chaperone modulatory protein CbpM
MVAGKEITVLSIDAQSELSLEELCDACHVTHEFIHELIDYGAIEPKGVSIEVWRFNPSHMHRIQTVIRLQNDLEVNLPGAALAIDLMDQIETMRAQLEFLEKHILTGRKF